MKKHKFSDKLPEKGTTILCHIWQKDPYDSRYGIFDVYFFEGGLKLEANSDFLYHRGDSEPKVFKIYHNEELDDKLMWWADLEEEE